MMQTPKQVPIAEPSWLGNELVTLGREINPTSQRQRAAAQVWQPVQTIPWSPATAWTSMPRLWVRTWADNKYPPPKKCKNPLSFHPKSQGKVLRSRGTSAGMSRGRLKVTQHHAALCPEASEVSGWWVLPNPEGVPPHKVGVTAEG